MDSLHCRRTQASSFGHASRKASLRPPTPPTQPGPDRIASYPDLIKGRAWPSSAGVPAGAMVTPDRRRTSRLPSELQSAQGRQARQSSDAGGSRDVHMGEAGVRDPEDVRRVPVSRDGLGQHARLQHDCPHSAQGLSPPLWRQGLHHPRTNPRDVPGWPRRPL